jgi:HEAT repeat protein
MLGTFEAESLRWHVIRALGKTRSVRAVPTLLVLLQNPTTTVSERFYIAEALGEIGDDRAVPDLIPLLDDTSDDMWRKVAGSTAIALGRIGDARAILPLHAALSHPFPEVRQQVAWALGQIEMDATTAEEILPALASTAKDIHHQVRCEALFALAQLSRWLGKDRIKPILLAALDDEDGLVRWGAQGQLTRLGISPNQTSDTSVPPHSANTDAPDTPEEGG